MKNIDLENVSLSADKKTIHIKVEEGGRMINIQLNVEGLKYILKTHNLINS